jgi:Ca2+-transporting ATPase
MAILPNELPAVLTIFLAAGAWRISQKRVLTRRTPAIEALGTATVLCVDKTGTLTFNRMAVRKIFAQGQMHDLFQNPEQKLPEEFHEIVEYGILAGDRDPFDPMERAFKQVGEAHLGQTEHLHPEWTLLKQYPLSPELLALSHVWTTVDGAMHPIAAKGAPEAIIELCHLNPEQSRDISTQVKDMAAAGLRVLGVAKSRFPDGPLPEKQHDFDFEFVGLVGLEDRLRPEVPNAIRECHSAGIRVIMITGDHPETARSIAHQINLPDSDAILTGTELNTLTDAQLQERVRTIHVCARMVPEQKLRLIAALKASGEIVAMTGDGVNDAPALKNAHIGIAMGQRGTDVARESASLVLLDDDFGSIVEAIKMGRRIFENLQHAMAYLLAVHIPITGISIIPVFFNLPLVLMPMHIAFLHLIIEPACSIAFEAEPTSQGVMQKPPRRLDERLFSKSFLLPTLWQGITVLIVLLAVFMMSLVRNQSEMEARTLTFATLIFASLGLVVSNRSWNEMALSRGLATNKAFLWVLGGTVAMLAVVLCIPSLRDLFRFAKMHPIDVALFLGAGLASGLSFEGVKALRRARGQSQGKLQARA